MSDHLQIGQHPDADQLSAFAEQSLTVYEREQTLAHLVECSRCRKIVALSLPPVEEPVLEEPEPLKEPWFGGWFSGWKMAWIAAPALAAVVVLTVYLQIKATNRQRSAEHGQVATVHPPAPAPPTAITSKDNPPPAKPLPRETSHPTALAKTAKVNPSSSMTAPDVLPATGRNILSAGQAPVAIRSGEAPASANGAMAGLAPGVAVAPFPPASRAAPPVVVAAAPVMQTAPESVTSSRPLVAAASPAAPGYVGRGVPNNSSHGIAAVRPGALGTVHSFAALSAPRTSSFAGLMSPLPSGQPVLSLAANARQRLAIDTQNHLFLSDDEGHHWKPVTPAWQGRAVAVVTALNPPAGAKVASFVSPERFTPEMRASAEPSAQPDAPNSSLSGVITDPTGAIVAGATIVVKESRYGLMRTEKTDATGRYLFANLAPGTYRIDAQAMGFASQSLVENLKPEQAVRNITLNVGAAAETVTVDAASVQLETHSRSEDVSALAAKKVAVQPAAQPAAPRTPIFVVTTDSGVRWTSSDGLTWKHE